MQINLNYNHLYYFWVVVKEGGVSAAASYLKISQPTVSAQLKSLEDSIGERLFEKSGRNLKLTEQGQIVKKYANQIFELSNELERVLSGTQQSWSNTLRIGISNVVPKTLSYIFLSPALDASPTIKLTCFEDSTDVLLSKLAIHELDLVITDSPIPPTINVLAFNHHLISCGVSFLVNTRVSKSEKSLTTILQSTPLLIPSRHAAVRTELDRWFEEQGIETSHCHEFQDSALMKVVARERSGVIPVPSIIDKELCKEMGFRIISKTEKPLFNFYLISTEKRIRQPVVASICQFVKNNFRSTE